MDLLCGIVNRPVKLQITTFCLEDIRLGFSLLRLSLLWQHNGVLQNIKGGQSVSSSFTTRQTMEINCKQCCSPFPTHASKIHTNKRKLQLTIFFKMFFFSFACYRPGLKLTVGTLSLIDAAQPWSSKNFF